MTTTVTVLGGAGAMGRRAVEALAAQPGVERVVVADCDEDRARAVAERVASDRVDALRVDARDHDALVQCLRGSAVVASALGPFYEFEVRCAAAAIDAGCHFVSICDDFDAAQEVLLLAGRAKAHGCTLLTGLGWTPGITNVLVAKAAAELERVDAADVCWASSASDASGKAVVLHTMHIFSGQVPSFDGGRPIRVAAGSGKRKVRFPEPLGEVDVFHVGHPEPLTLPLTFGTLQRATLRGGLSESGLAEIAIEIGRLGLIDTHEKRAMMARLVEPLLPLVGQRERSAQACSAARVDVTGVRNGTTTTLTYAATASMPTLTGVPLAIGAGMLARGEIAMPGVVTPEACVLTTPFLDALKENGIALWEGDACDHRLL